MKRSKIFIAFLALLVFSQNCELFSVTSKDVFKKYRHNVFVESGSFRGDGIQNALSAGYEEVHSIEIAPHHYEYCKESFKNNPKVHLYLGNSIDVLPKILENLKETATFWLDGHYSWGDTGKGDSYTPILEELNIISSHDIKEHTILIDDVRQFGCFEFDYIELNQIIDLLLIINPQYTIKYENGFIENDVLVAEIEK